MVRRCVICKKMEGKALNNPKVAPLASKGSTDNVINVGEVLLLKGDKSACSLWKLAKIVELIPSRDNEIRATKVRVVNSDEGRSLKCNPASS